MIFGFNYSRVVDLSQLMSCRSSCGFLLAKRRRGMSHAHCIGLDISCVMVRRLRAPGAFASSNSFSVGSRSTERNGMVGCQLRSPRVVLQNSRRCYLPDSKLHRPVVMVFSGIVEEMGKVLSIQDPGSSEGGMTMDVGAVKTFDGVSLGDSISVNGVCLTVTAMDDSWFRFGVAPETLRLTNLGALRVGSPVNLERSLPANGRLGGHVVQGHVDATGTIVSVRPDKEALVFEIEVPKSLMKYIVKKGYVAVDGTSLTVCEVSETSFTFMMIPYTQAQVVTATKRAGDVVNIEVDVTGKYIENIVSAYLNSDEFRQKIPEAMRAQT